MKLIIAGATGFVATEVIRLALSNPRVTSVIALARRITPVPQNTARGAGISKLKAVACDDFEEYPEDVKKELSNADACIWLLAVTPSKSKTMYWEEGKVESFVLNYAKESKGEVESAVAKPGLINAPGKMSMAMNILSRFGHTAVGFPMVDVSEVAATLIDQSLNGFEKDTLLNDDLIRIGQKALAEQQTILGGTV
ncbi:nucleoside-diphosphate-sugar epimerase, putative [Paecilomyces variotii No. 5]|uniref:Nucleoside-diphosphate-sugar epimerase, putative n=1 Tax=Byssochlamys spectabilis (strain No. 5 / NBRC 109023) TaxID=1356009 RepID=V5HVG7_BYSSN|nr:nucleoside-diphosphate-sugar epimerase, putative [Paecilomyces variotii No. 5]